MLIQEDLDLIAGIQAPPWLPCALHVLLAAVSCLHETGPEGVEDTTSSSVCNPRLLPRPYRWALGLCSMLGYPQTVPRAAPQQHVVQEVPVSPNATVTPLLPVLWDPSSRSQPTVRLSTRDPQGVGHQFQGLILL